MLCIMIVSFYSVNKINVMWSFFLFKRANARVSFLYIISAVWTIPGVVGVFCDIASVQPQSETVWRQADRYWVPRILFVNKLDRTSADCFHVIYNVNKKLNARAVAM